MEIYGRLEEDLKQFFSVSLGFLKQKNFPEKVFINQTTLKLKGPVATQ